MNYGNGFFYLAEIGDFRLAQNGCFHLALTRTLHIVLFSLYSYTILHYFLKYVTIYFR